MYYKPIMMHMHLLSTMHVKLKPSAKQWKSTGK